MSAFVVYPAIDVRAGRVVRLRQGDYEAETAYAPAPLQLAQAYAEQGARWLHLVDLDGARGGRYDIESLLRAIVAGTTLQVQTGGGIRSGTDIERLLAAGAARVVVGSIAVREPDTVAAWLARFSSERLVIALDARRDASGTWRTATDGWTQGSGIELSELAIRYAHAGATHVLCTDIARDGMLSGPNLDLYAWLLALAPELQVQASGGLRDLDDVVAVRRRGCAGAVLGRALLEGGLDLRGALAC